MKTKLKLDKNGKKEFWGHVMAPVLVGTVFIVSAGRLDLYRPWIWIILLFLYYFGGLAVILKMNPLLLNERGGWKDKKNTKPWDMYILQIFAITGLWGHTVLMGLDIGRYEWSQMESWTLYAGIAIYLIAFVLVYWAMAVNAHFEPTVRIQSERNHQVIREGPYRVVRHPGYLGLILSTFASTMVLGSVYGLITSVATLIVLGIRTWLEDRILQNELEAYPDYAKKTRFRLIPFVW